MNNVMKRKINEFIQEYFSDVDFEYQGGRNKKPEDQIWGLKYEYFVNAFEVYGFKKEIDVEDTKRLSTGSLRGIDSVYLVINNKFFAIPEDGDSDYSDFICDIDQRLKDNFIDATFYFTQVKSQEANLGGFNTYYSSVYDVFDLENRELGSNKRIRSLRTAFEKIAAKTESINLVLKYCVMHKDTRKINLIKIQWENDIKKATQELQSTTFSNVSIDLLSGQEYYNQLSNFNTPNKRSFEVIDIKSRFVGNDRDGIKTHLGFLSLYEVVNLLKDQYGNLDDKNVFFDNIRYFQGDTTVNSKISDSLSHNTRVFHVLHNGLIITSSEAQFNPANGNLIIKGFSIVNGCQTCTIIWNWYQNLLKSTCEETKIVPQLRDSLIPVKIVITPDYELKSRITEAANTQNQIKSINLIAISETAKSLEKKYGEVNWKKRKEILNFQRLPMIDASGVSALNVSLEDVARSFYSTFYKAPHEIAKSFGKYLDSKLKTDDFLSDSSGKSYDVNSYLITSVTFNYLVRFIKSRYNTLVSLRNHLLMLFFLDIDPTFEQRNPKSLDPHFVQHVIQIVDDKDLFEKECIRICDFAIDYLDFFIDSSSLDKPRVIPKSYYTEDNTQRMLTRYWEFVNGNS